MHIDFYLYILVIDLLVGITLYRRIEPPAFKLLIPFLLLTLLVEGTGLITSRLHWNNLRMFNFFTCFEFLFYTYLYTKLIQNKKWRGVMNGAMAIYPVLFLINIFFIEGFTRFHSITYRIGSVMVVFWCCLYFRELMQSPGYTPIFRIPAFWLSTGLLFFYTGFFFYMSAAYILLYTHLVIDKLVWQAISGTLNTLLYGSVLIVFLCRMSVKKRS